MPSVVNACAQKRDLAACLRIQDDLITSFHEVQVQLRGLRVVHTQARGIPLGALVDVKKLKAVLFDVGIHQRLLGLDVPEYMTSSDLGLVNRGSVAEVFTGLELVGNHPSHTRPTLHYWHREARGSNAEVDSMIQQGAEIVPVEVKAGTGSDAEHGPVNG
jgi:hypothetical protein